MANIDNHTQAQDIHEQVMVLLCWTALQYGEFRHQMGEEYLLKNLLGQDKYGYGELSQSRIYWRWWINQWNFRDEGFVQYAAHLPQHQRAVQYKKLHFPRSLRFHPHKVILERIYSEIQSNIKRQ